MASVKANATLLGFEHVDYTKDGVKHDFYNIHYAYDPLPDDEGIEGQYAKQMRFQGSADDLNAFSIGQRVRLLWENDPKWNRAILTGMIAAD